jgi:hypothetical protein
MHFLKNIFNTQNVQDKLDHGEVITKTISIFFQIITFLSCILGLIFWAIDWKVIGYLSFGKVLGFIIFKVATLFIILFVTKFLILRYKQISDFENHKFIIGPIFSLIIRTGGEASFIAYTLLSIPTMISMWFSTPITRSIPFLSDMFYNLRSLDIESMFLLSIIVFIVMILAGIIILIVTRYLSETIEAFFSIANEVKHISEIKKDSLI